MFFTPETPLNLWLLGFAQAYLQFCHHVGVHRSKPEEAERMCRVRQKAGHGSQFLPVSPSVPSRQLDRTFIFTQNASGLACLLLVLEVELECPQRFASPGVSSQWAISLFSC